MRVPLVTTLVILGLCRPGGCSAAATYCTTIGTCLECEAAQAEGCSWASCTFPGTNQTFNECVEQTLLEEQKSVSGFSSEQQAVDLVEPTCVAVNDCGPQACESLLYCSVCESFPQCSYCDSGHCVDTQKADTKHCGSGATTIGPRCANYCSQFTGCTTCQHMDDGETRVGCVWGDGCFDIKTTAFAVPFTSCKAVPTDAPSKNSCKSFDAGSFFGGIALGLGLFFIGFLVTKIAMAKRYTHVSIQDNESATLITNADP